MSMVAMQPKLYGLVAQKLVIDVIVVVAAAQKMLWWAQICASGQGVRVVVWGGSLWGATPLPTYMPPPAGGGWAGRSKTPSPTKTPYPRPRVVGAGKVSRTV